MIYLDAAATSNIKPSEVVDAVCKAMTNGCGNCGRGVNEASLEASHIVQNARNLIAEFFNFPNASCVAFTSNSTQALNIAINGTIKKGMNIVTTEAEHNSVLRPLFFQKNIGSNLTIIPLTNNGNINYEILNQKLLEKTDVLVITLASNVTGNITDLEKIDSILKSVKIKTGKKPIIIADASQLAGTNYFDCSFIDILCCTGHKSLFGPQGTGFICVKPDIKVEPLIRGGTGFDSFNENQPEKMPSSLEAGTLNAHGIAGLSEGIQFIKKIGIKKIQEHEMALTQQFYNGIQKINTEYKKNPIILYGDFSKNKDGLLNNRSPIVSLNINKIDSSEISDILSFEYGIATRSGAHCAPLVHKHFHTEKQGMVRFSFNWFTKQNDIQTAIDSIESIQSEINS